MNRSSKSNKRSAASLDEQFTGLLKATLETWAHQVLYTRRIYPSASFAPTTVWGIRCRACRAKEVVLYIRDSIETGVTALRKGSASCLSLVIVEERDTYEDDFRLMSSSMEEEGEDDPAVEKERLTLSFVRVGQIRDAEILEQTERSMRDLLLRTMSLPDRRGQAVITDSTSFRLVWHLEPDQSDYGDMNRNFDNGTWIESKSSFQGGLVRRPLHHASSPLLQVNFFSQTRSTVKSRAKQRNVPAAAKRPEDEGEDEIVL